MAELTGYEKNNLEDYTKDELVSIAQKYTIYYTTKKGVGSISNYSRLTKDQLISLIRNDRDYKRANPSFRFRRPDTDLVGNLDRFYELKKSLTGKESPEYLMDEIIRLAQDTIVDYVIPARHYTFLYYAGTPGIKYDRHPLITCTELSEKGFIGYNYHWPMYRQYKNEYPGERIQSDIYEISDTELRTLQRIPYARKVQL